MFLRLSFVLEFPFPAISSSPQPLIRDIIIEIATIVTDAELNVLAEGPSLAVKQPDALLDGMDEWNTRQHGQSGLTQRVRDSQMDQGRHAPPLDPPILVGH